MTEKALKKNISPQGEPVPVKYPLSEERQGITLKFKIVAKRDDYVAHRTYEDDIYDQETRLEPRIVVGYCTVSTYDDGTPGEVFLVIGKEGHELHGWADKWSRLFSMLLQYGVDPRIIYEAMKFQTFEPQGLTNTPKVRMCKSIPDLIARWMEATFPPTAQEAGDIEDMSYNMLLESIIDQ